MLQIKKTQHGPNPEDATVSVMAYGAVVWVGTLGEWTKAITKKR